MEIHNEHLYYLNRGYLAWLNVMGGGLDNPSHVTHFYSARSVTADIEISATFRKHSQRFKNE